MGANGTEQRSLSLYEISAELAPLEAALRDTGGEVTGDDALVERVTELLDRVRDKVDGFGMYYTSLKALVNGLAAEEDRLRARRAALEWDMKRLKEAAKRSMEMRGIQKVEGKLFSISVQKNGGKPPVRLMVPVEQLPARFTTVKVAPDLERIREALIEGDPKAAEIAKIGETETSVRIR